MAPAEQTKYQKLEAHGKELVGQTAMYAVRSRHVNAQSGSPEIAFPVRIKKFKVGFGRLRLLIEPVGGEGQWWVDETSPYLRLKK